MPSTERNHNTGRQLSVIERPAARNAKGNRGTGSSGSRSKADRTLESTDLPVSGIRRDDRRGRRHVKLRSDISNFDSLRYKRAGDTLS